MQHIDRVGGQAHDYVDIYEVSLERDISTREVEARLGPAARKALRGGDGTRAA